MRDFEYEQKIRGFSVLLSELPEEEREPFRKYLIGQTCPALLPDDPLGDLRAWLPDYERWRNNWKR